MFNVFIFVKSFLGLFLYNLLRSTIVQYTYIFTDIFMHALPYTWTVSFRLFDSYRNVPCHGNNEGCLVIRFYLDNEVGGYPGALFSDRLKLNLN